MSGIGAVASEPCASQENSHVEGTENVAGSQVQGDRRATRSSRRPTSHFNTFQTSCQPSWDNPPSYASVPKQTAEGDSRSKYGMERLPGYSCSVMSEGKAWFKLESYNPLNGTFESSWKEVYLTLRGTLFQIHRLKDQRPGKLIRTYTLQHAEVGLATDATYTVLIPQTRFAHLIPSGHRQRAWQRDNSLYTCAKQSILRLRAEADQFLLAHDSEERIFQWINLLGTAIDISPAIDDRSIPRQCTVPRRRRRRTAQDSNDVEDPGLRAEQEQIWRAMYPSFAQDRSHHRPELSRTTTEDAQTIDPRQNTARDDDEIDLAMMREDTPLSSIPADSTTLPPTQRPGVSRQTTASTISSTTPPIDHPADAKWEPPQTRTPAQAWRYIRRCMPVLLVDAPRASDILICHGRRLRVNWRMELLEEWELKPPSYRAHKFGLAAETTAGEHAAPVPPTSSDIAAEIATATIVVDAPDVPTPATTSSCSASCIEGLEGPDGAHGNYELAKVRTAGTTASHRTYMSGADIPSVIFCF